MNKKCSTMRDIANYCNVSLATVSYVLNNSEHEHISHATRLRVLEAAKLLNYIPKSCKISKHTSKNNLVGIIISLEPTACPSKKIIYYDLATELQKELSKFGYDTILSTTYNHSSTIDIIAKHTLAAVFLIDMDSTNINQITRNYYVPILFLDCSIPDPLFCKVCPNYDVIITEARRILHSNELFLIMDDISNVELKKLITSHFSSEHIFLNTSSNNLELFLQAHKGKKGIVIGDLLGLQVQSYFPKEQIVIVSFLMPATLFPPNTNIILLSNTTKAKVAVNLLTRQLRLEYTSYSDNTFWLNPDTILSSDTNSFR